MIVLDANVIIAFLDSSDAHHMASIELIADNMTGGLGASALTLAEALVHPTRGERGHAAWNSLREIGLQVVAVEESDVTALAEIRNEHRVRMPDAVALQAARKLNARLATFDHALANAAHAAGVSVAP